MPDTEEKNDKRDASDMELGKMYVPDIPKNIVFPDELNAYLREQIQYLTYENGMLKKNSTDNELKLKQSETQIQNLSKQVRRYEDATTSNIFSSVSNVASAKIVDLSKKLREKSSELEALKTKCSRLNHQIYLLQQRPETEQNDMVPTKEKPSNELEEQVKHLQEQLSVKTSKLFDVRNSNMQLKTDIKIANKLLQQEVGESFENLQGPNGCNWRGRAQIICDLQQKNSELKDKLRQCQQKAPKIEFQPKNDQRLELSLKENANLKSEVVELKRKLDGARARCKIYDSECAVLRAKMSVLNEQKDNDRETIATLTTKLSNVRKLENDELKHKDELIQKLNNDYKNLMLECSKHRCKCENMQRELQEKAVEITDLENNESRPSSRAADDRIIGRLEAERLRLLELIEVVNKRLGEERTSVANLQLQYKSERQRTARLEAKLARAELQRCDKNSLYSVQSSFRSSQIMDESVEDRLELAEENVKALKARLEMERRERQLDFQEFADILRNYSPTCGSNE